MLSGGAPVLAGTSTFLYVKVFFSAYKSSVKLKTMEMGWGIYRLKGLGSLKVDGWGSYG